MDIAKFIRERLDLDQIKVSNIIIAELDVSNVIPLDTGQWISKWIRENNLDIVKIREIIENLAVKFPKQKKKRGRPQSQRLSSPTELESIEPDPENDIKHFQKMDRDIQDLTKTVKSGHTTALIVSGRGGLGKTFNVEKILGNSENWESFTGTVTPLAIYVSLFMNRKKGQVLVFDDVNIFKNDDMINMVKAVLDSKPIRIVSWLSKITRAIPKSAIHDDGYFAEIENEYWDAVEAGKESDFRFPNKFKFEGNVIFITNKSMDWLANHQQIGAVVTRSMSIDYKMNKWQALAKMETILPHIESGIDLSLKERLFLEVKNRVIDGKMANINMRSFVKIVKLIPSGLSEERIIELIDYA